MEGPSGDNSGWAATISKVTKLCHAHEHGKYDTAPKYGQVKMGNVDDTADMGYGSISEGGRDEVKSVWKGGLPPGGRGDTVKISGKEA